MKRKHFALDERQVALLFSVVRDKVDVIRLLMNSIKIMLLNEEIAQERIKGELILHVSSMSRLIFVSENKIFSVNFPFSVQLDGEDISFSSVYCEEIDHKITSEVLGLVSSGNLAHSLEIYSLADKVIETQEWSYGFWSIVQELMMFEDGYLRYDHDPERSNGKLHPLHHLDLCYSSSSTFKIGLNQEISKDCFIDLLDIESDCHYLDSK